ncbi:Deoxycytidylate deaminase [Escovopsis weberi]|uniref:Deoxycytidylate deaminase n=1 Tax=Escovopsis weberi TaxID=150374 RepID=A0A0M8N420_ESCWE|nr:Deoxycytidylate deaminase [Escovopsis weberi]
MLIGICGSICAGKRTVAQYLIDHHGFNPLYLRQESSDQNGALTDSSSATSIEVYLHKFRSGVISDSNGNGEHSTQAGGSLETGLADTGVFETPEELLDYVTRHWNRCFVTTDIFTEKVLNVLVRRPFFLHVSIDAPLTVRWRRYQQRASRTGDSDVSLEDFVAANDRHQYDPGAGLQPLIARATVRLLNTSSSLAHLFATLGRLNIPNPERLRPSWDSYFMALASLAAQRSNCMKRRVGCVLVSKEHRVISTGYNGTPRGQRNCNEGGCGRCNSGNGSGVGLATCLCLHAEENALLEAGRERIREGSILYCDTCPCLTCSIKICQLGIHEVVYAYTYSMDKETADVLGQAGVKLRQFIPVCEPRRMG